jgi:hypothetical protein
MLTSPERSTATELDLVLDGKPTVITHDLARKRPAPELFAMCCTT